MARLVLAVLFVGVLFLSALLVVRTLRSSVVAVDRARGMDMAENGMLPKIAYFLLLALILYATFTASGA